MNKKMSGLIVASAVCALFATVSHADDAPAAKGTMPMTKKGGVSCQGSNDCKGKGGCKSDANSCKGKNDCAKHAFMAHSKKACKSAKGEVVTPKPADSKS